MYHIIYKTTLLKENKFYIGKHSTNNLNDNYYGSSEYVKDYIRSNGLKDVKREILAHAECKNQLSALESVYIHSAFNHPNNINKAKGISLQKYYKKNNINIKQYNCSFQDEYSNYRKKSEFNNDLLVFEKKQSDKLQKDLLHSQNLISKYEKSQSKLLDRLMFLESYKEKSTIRFESEIVEIYKKNELEKEYLKKEIKTLEESNNHYKSMCNSIQDSHSKLLDTYFNHINKTL